MPASGPRRFIDIFPPGFDINSRSLSSRGHYHFHTGQLYQRLTDEYHPEKHVDSTIVKSVWYGKQKKLAGHEFILIEVEDTQAELKNYIVLDRNLNENVAPSSGDIQPTKLARNFRSFRGIALDAFRVSYNGVEKQLLQECQLWPRDYLEKLEFDPADPLFLYQLAALASAVSEKCSNYYLAGQNCYWYAGLIWECLRMLRPSADHAGHLAQKRGQFSYLRFSIPVEEKDEIYSIFQKQIRLAEERLQRGRQMFEGLTTNSLPRRLNRLLPSFNSIASIPSNNRGHYSFSPEDIYRRLTGGYDPQIHIERTVVKSARYGKHLNWAQHEFILVEVEDTDAHLTNYIVLDRNNHSKPPRSEASEANPRPAIYQSQCSQGVALDNFRVSYSGTEEQLLEECHLQPFKRLERMDFNSTEPLYLYQLVTLAHVVSARSPKYSVSSENCYWFAGLIWDCLRLFRPNALYDGCRAKRRGTFASFNYAPQARERDEIWGIFQREIQNVEKRISTSRDWQQWNLPSATNWNLEAF